MKKPFSRRIVRRVTGNFFLLAASVLVLVYSCKKDIAPSQTTIPLNATAQSAAVKDAKSWFDTNAKINKQPSKTTNALNQQKWNDGLNLDWNKPDVYGKYNGTLVELPLVNSSVVFAFDRTNTNGITQQNNYTKTSFIVQKDSSGVFRGWYMVLIADTTYINGNFDKLKLNTYKSRDKDFSGRLLYYTPQGDFLAGWRYEKGVITKTISIASGAETGTGSKKINAKQEVNVARVCFDRPVVTTTASCFTDPNTGMYDCTYTYTTTYLQECYDAPDGGGGGGGGGSGGGGSGGGGTTFPPPPKPDCPPVAVASVRGPQVNVAEGGGGGGGTTPCNPAPPTNLDTDCSSFNFKKTSSANWQEAGVKNIRLKWVWFGGGNNGMSREIYLPQAVFGLPTQYQNANGTVTPLSAGAAAVRAAVATETAKRLTYTEFRDSPYFPNDAAVLQYFREQLQLQMAVMQGTAGVNGSGSSNISFSDEQRSFFLTLNCDQ